MGRSLLSNIDDNAERYLLLIFYTMVVGVIGVEVFRRFVISFSSIWGEEIARFGFIYLTWIGASAGVKIVAGAKGQPVESAPAPAAAQNKAY